MGNARDVWGEQPGRRRRDSSRDWIPWGGARVLEYCRCLHYSGVSVRTANCFGTVQPEVAGRRYTAWVCSPLRARYLCHRKGHRITHVSARYTWSARVCACTSGLIHKKECRLIRLGIRIEWAHTEQGVSSSAPKERGTSVHRYIDIRVRNTDHYDLSGLLIKLKLAAPRY